MAVKPKNISQSPTPLDVDEPRGDVLADILGATLLRNAMYKRIECGQPWGMRVASQPRAVFYLVARGTARFEIAGEPVRLLSAGDALFVPHGGEHVMRDSDTTTPRLVCDGVHRAATGAGSVVKRLGSGPTTTSIVAGFFQFSGRKPALLEAMPQTIPLVATDPTQNRWISATLQLILAESTSPGPASALVLQRLADVLLVQALRSLVTDGGCRTGMAALADPPIHEALTVMHRHTAKAWTVATLAKSVGLSRSAFAARFNGVVGESPLQYLARWRVARAAELLRESDERVSDIASRVGYDSVPSFSKAFRRWQGESPRGYRDQWRASRNARPDNGPSFHAARAST